MLCFETYKVYKNMADPESKSKDKSLWVQYAVCSCKMSKAICFMAQMTVTQSEIFNSNA